MIQPFLSLLKAKYLGYYNTDSSERLRQGCIFTFDLTTNLLLIKKKSLFLKNKWFCIISENIVSMECFEFVVKYCHLENR